jgi:hypothetical protein
MQNITAVFDECHTILLAIICNSGEKVGRWFTQIGADKKRRYLKVEWWKGEMVTRRPRKQVHQAIYCVITACRGPRQSAQRFGGVV